MPQKRLDALTKIAQAAGAAILEDKKRSSKVEYKEDESPVTSADLASHREIMKGLEALDPHIPVMSEESKTLPFEERKKWSTYYLVDPLDGTKEFIKGKKEYTVNIALITDGVPVMGVVFVPELGETFSGADSLGAFKTDATGKTKSISVAAKSSTPPKIVGSSSHASKEMVTFLEGLGEHQLLEFGSSLKLCQIADGTADFYPRFGPTSEWDTAAGHAVVLHAGGSVVTLDGKALDYNQKDSVLNPAFFVVGPKDHDWLGIAAAAY
jgi:3'(2'), 5'-bisphosphate nucleotidase